MYFYLYPAVQMIMLHQDPPDKEMFQTRTFNSIELGDEIHRELGTNIDTKTHITSSTVEIGPALGSLFIGLLVMSKSKNLPVVRNAKVMK
jgi:hypothetical protein